MHSPEANVGASVAFVRFLNVVKLKWKTRVLNEIAGSRELLRNRRELMMISSIVIQFYETYQLDLDALVF